MYLLSIFIDWFTSFFPTKWNILPRFCGGRLVALQPLHMSPSLIDRILHCTWPAKNTNCKQTTNYNNKVCNYINKQKLTYQIFVFAHSFLFQVFAKNWAVDGIVFTLFHRLARYSPFLKIISRKKRIKNFITY